jgi:hypothetical protein
MALRDVVAYVIRHYPHAGELTKGRLTKIVYLIDWASAVRRGRQVTDIKWVFDHHGPFVYDVYDMAESDRAFRVSDAKNAYGSDIRVIGLRDPSGFQRLDAETTAIIDDVIAKVSPMNWSVFIAHVYGTYPIRSVERYNPLPLVALAREMRREKTAG